MKEKLIRIAPILLIIAIAILSIITLVTVAKIFMGEENTQTQQTSSTQKDTSSEELTKNEAGRGVKMTVRGPIVANEDFRSYTVEVSQNSRKLTTYKGYLGEVIQQVPLENNANAYNEFINALNKANMMKGEALTGDADNLAGVCATGHIYDFAILKDGTVTKHLWTSTCAGSKGSLLANTKQLQQLFISQVPGNEKVVRDLGLDKL